jgi:hypothetical protein
LTESASELVVTDKPLASKAVALRYPPIYPYPYYQSRFFKGQETPTGALPIDPSRVKVYTEHPLIRGRLMSDFDKINIERSGFMVGEYVAFPERQLLMDRNGVCISINFPWDVAPLPNHLWEVLNYPAFWDLRQRLLDSWDTIPVVENAAVLGHVYVANYYHFTYEALQILRLIESYDVKNLVVSTDFLAQPFQKHLFLRAVGDRTIFAGGEVVRVRNPVVAQGCQSLTAVQWLRNITGALPEAGNKRYYVRRSPEKFRSSTNISETPEFLEFLRKYGFETIDFGNGENSISEQIAMMKDAAVVLSPHGAGLTNISYLSAPLTIIEIFGRDVVSASFMQIAVCLGFDYHGFICDEADDQECMVVDIGKLSNIMDELS